MKRPWYFIMMPGTKTNQSITLSETFICYVKCNIAKYRGASSDAPVDPRVSYSYLIGGGTIHSKPQERSAILWSCD